MLITYCSNDSSAKYGSNIHAVEAAMLPYEDMTAITERFAHVVPVDVDENGIFGFPNALVIDTDCRLDDAPDVPVTMVRPKGTQELLVDEKEAAVMRLSATTNALIKSIADTDRQNSITIMYNNMSTTDKARAKTYFDWHKNMLAKHSELKTAIAATATVEDLQTLQGADEFAAHYAELIAAAPIGAVDLASYIH